MENAARIDLSESYLMLEANKLNEEIASLLSEIRLREKFVLGIIAAVPAWIYNELIPHGCSRIETAIGIAIIISQLVITLCVGYSVWLLYQRINYMGAYLKKIEEYYFIDKDKVPILNWLGWERFHDDRNKSKNYLKFTFTLWVVFVLFPLAEYILFKNIDWFK